MSGNSEMLAAFDSLAKTVVDIKIGNSIAKAQEKADAIRTDQKMNEFEKIKAQQSIANMMGSSVLSMGGDASMAQQARLALAPQIPDQTMAALEATGESTIAGARGKLELEAAKKEKDMLKYKNDLEMEKQRAHDNAMKELYGVKADAKNNKVQPMTQKVTANLDKIAQTASQWNQVAAGVEKLGAGKLLTPEMMGDNERTMFERLKASTEAGVRKDIFGATLTPGEEKEFNNIRGGLMKSGLTTDQFAAGFKQLANLQKQVYVRSLQSNVIARIGTEEQNLKHFVANKDLFGPDELKSNFLSIKSAASSDPVAQMEAQFSPAPRPASAQGPAGYPVGQGAAPTPGGSIPGFTIKKK